MLHLLLKAALVSTLLWSALGVLLSRAVQPPNLDGLQIVYSTFDGTTRFNFRVINSEGADPKYLGTDDHVIEQIVCSPNGRYAGVISRPAASHTTLLSIMQADGIVVQEYDISHLDGATDFSLSNDGMYVAFAATDGIAEHSRLLIFDQLDPQGRVIFTGDLIHKPAFSPDGGRIYFGVHDGEAFRMIVMTLNNESVSMIPALPQKVTLGHWSPDGSVIRQNSDYNSLLFLSSYILDLSTMRERGLRDNPILFSVGWSPDGLGFITSTNRADLQLYNLGGSPLRMITVPVEDNAYIYSACFLTDRPLTLVQP